MQGMGKLVLGIGNALLRDEGIGCHVINALAETALPDVRVIDGGTCPDLWQLIGDTDKLVIVDAVRGGGTPGQIYRFHPDDISLEQRPLLSVHDMGLVDNLRLMRLWNSISETVIIGVEPKDVNWGLELSPELQCKMPHIIDIVISELNNTNPKGEMKC
jgi:hydrogenase maturation protease